MSILKVDNLQRQYGDVKAVDGISFEVQPGEIFGIVGPNGAGKTTTIECIEGLRKPSSGTIELLGKNPQTRGFELRQQIGMQLQESALPDRLLVWEALDLFATFYKKTLPADDLIRAVGLEEKRKTPFDKLSGGQKQRLYIALALINDPEVVFLDELTTGLDPHARRAIWDLIEDVRNRGKTVILSTHFMEEAERLCDRVAIVDHGQIVALDTPENLINELGAERRIVVTLDDGLTDEQRDYLSAIEGVEKVDWQRDRAVVYTKDETVLVEVVRTLVGKSIPFKGLRTEQANLEDVFLAQTGRQLRENGGAE